MRWIGDLAGERARISPNQTALIEAHSGRRLSFLGVDDRARRVATALRRRGVGVGDRVAVLARNRLELFDLFFACGKLGATLVPLNLRLSPGEIAFLLRDCDPRLVAHAEEFRAAVGDGFGPTLDLDQTWPEVLAEEPATEAAEVDPEDLAFLLYTGGTTGSPKGAMIPWRAVWANAVSTILTWGLSARDVSPLLFPLFHTGGWNVITLPLFVAGGKLVLMGDFDAAGTLATIERERATIVIGVPTMFHAMMSHPGFVAADLSSVREFVSGGAPCPVSILERYWARGARMRMGYGLTEVGPNNFYFDPEEACQRPRSVGKPSLSVEILLVDEAGENVAAGQEGELALRGPGVCRGYWRRPEESAAALLPGGWFRTGDIARVDEDGFTYIVDRRKDMFISGGENVFPVEIEQVLATHPAVDLVAVIGIPDEKWGEVGKAFVRLRPGARVREKDLLAFCRERLGRYKVPKIVELVEDLPLVGPGKISKAELRRRQAPKREEGSS